eukprot:CAMPEP_0204225404 /NCGR_PEP_ID=MMETSP0361-20130328/84181_1 /ASSEMBLY_ACC=CAM_ASM_000343 /TAXON_ID=268821 /ORGANISM="Scrippsiella Hangoei, Strain SHTV-5" /LENGTH=71 /DNA_ID=CAMNT_0051191867 /DNA_START=67 /DNA_END=278 /DNA_ORIENTATION=-
MPAERQILRTSPFEGAALRWRGGAMTVHEGAPASPLSLRSLDEHEISNPGIFEPFRQDESGLGVAWQVLTG